MKALKLFDYSNGKKVRTANIDGSTWFFAVDVCNILEIKNSRDALSDLKDKYKLTVGSSDGQTGHGGAQFYSLISEYGIYALVFKSRKKEALAFQEWIQEVVIPSIRRTGSYSIQPQEHRSYIKAFKFVERVFANYGNVSTGYFSVITELYNRVYSKLEMTGYIIPDYSSVTMKELRPDISVGKLFPKWLDAHYPEFRDDWIPYKHELPNGKFIEARQYLNKVLPAFIEYVENTWLPENAIKYFSERDPKALPFVKKALIRLGHIEQVNRLEN